jgi:hypothetical protein
VFPLTRKYFPLTNFSNGKQTQKSLENDFPKTTFRKTIRNHFFHEGKEALSEMEKEVLTHVRNVSKFYMPTKFKD